MCMRMVSFFVILCSTHYTNPSLVINTNSNLFIRNKMFFRPVKTFLYKHMKPSSFKPTTGMRFREDKLSTLGI